MGPPYYSKPHFDITRIQAVFTPSKYEHNNNFGTFINEQTTIVRENRQTLVTQQLLKNVFPTFQNGWFSVWNVGFLTVLWTIYKPLKNSIKPLKNSTFQPKYNNFEMFKKRFLNVVVWPGKQEWKCWGDTLSDVLTWSENERLRYKEGCFFDLN